MTNTTKKKKKPTKKKKVAPPPNMTKTRIRALRLAKGLTQQQLAQRLDVGIATVNRWENGGAAPSRKSTVKLVRVLR